MPMSGHLTGAVAAFAAVLVLRRIIKAQSSRSKRIQLTQERVLIVGASSGLGRALAKQYVARGAKVCVVARRNEPLKLRGQLLQQWDGLDTMHVCAGVSAVQPVMALTGIKSSTEDPDVAGVQHAIDIVGRATQGNFFGPLIAAITLIPMMKRTSASPAILLVSSIAAVVPAPTRAVYAATKAASLLLFQSLAIEHPQIAFTCMLPATIEGNFRSSAVDADPSEQTDETNKKGLKVEYVATRCAQAVDQGLRGNVVIPWIPYAIAHHLYYIWPSFIERQARKKYNFTTWEK
ncbi:short-chain dehydrogenase [Xylaria sp. FL1777]|nr:short-chain dehydrogenase [Xylaria sp. FL1777]